VLRVVLDTSVLVSTLLVPDGVPAKILTIWRANYFALFTSPAITDELSRIAALPRIRKKYNVTDQQVADLLGLLAEYATLVPGTASVTDAPLRDPNDFIILAAAADAEADLLVTSDQDLLVLGTFRSTLIVSPREFVQQHVSDEGDGPPRW
jgi:putative PIN family toxin of toxin-antitoxin system